MNHATLVAVLKNATRDPASPPSGKPNGRGCCASWTRSPTPRPGSSAHGGKATPRSCSPNLHRDARADQPFMRR